MLLLSTVKIALDNTQNSPTSTIHAANYPPSLLIVMYVLGVLPL